jgi:cell division protein FtsB
VRVEGPAPLAHAPLSIVRWGTAVLAVAVLGVQGMVWLGRDNMPQVMSLRKQLAEQQAANEAARLRNARTLAEVSDLKEGLEMVEEKARGELGMLKPDEIFVQLTPRR